RKHFTFTPQRGNKIETCFLVRLFGTAKNTTISFDGLIFVVLF
ncbi:unnamed protein product, partial [Tenebrio molitor]